MPYGDTFVFLETHALEFPGSNCFRSGFYWIRSCRGPLRIISLLISSRLTLRWLNETLVYTSTC
jgi:hypothetical protein